MILYEVTAANKTGYPHDSFLICFETYVVASHYKRLNETFLMNTHNIWFRGEIRNMRVKSQ